MLIEYTHADVGVEPVTTRSVIWASCCETDRNVEYNIRQLCLILRVKWILSGLYADLLLSSRVQFNRVVSCDCNLDPSGMQKS